MDHSNLRSNATRRITELLNSHEARRHLSTYGWTDGMPVVIAEPHELVEDVMGFISTQGRAVLLVLCGTEPDDLQIWHVTVPSPVFPEVPALAADSTVGDLCRRNSESRLTTFRVGYWAHSAAIHEIPFSIRTQSAPGTEPAEQLDLSDSQSKKHQD
ncbi:hypothetical protein [Glutamicibacter arilaitensis]|uniref:hypothetical protein n=1 Tax=Glutamicibacter arilaitensis TaxID=256701 RepID=UPI003A94DFBB